MDEEPGVGPAQDQWVREHQDNWGLVVKAWMVVGLYPNLVRVDSEGKVKIHSSSAYD